MFYRINTENRFFVVFVSILLSVLIACQSSEKKLPDQVTYYAHIAPILYQKCMPCHIDGEAGPFPLLTFDEVHPKAKLIQYVTEHRIMPPWPADPEYRHFANENVLTPYEIALITKWAETGARSGNASEMPSVTIRQNRTDSRKPDRILRFRKPIHITGNNKDMFVVLKIPFELPQDTFLQAVEFVPSAKRVAHHMNAHIVQFDDFKKRNVFEGVDAVIQDQSNSLTIHKDLGLMHDDGSFPTLTPSVCNYLPGSQFSFYPNEIGGYRVKRKGAMYINDFHFGPSPIDIDDSSYFKLYYAATPPKRPVSEFQLGTLGIAPVVPDLIVPPNVVKTFHITSVVPDDISILTIVPHMHLIGKSFVAYAVKPDGDTIPLVRIPRWDFRWQYFYQPETLLHIPRGSTIYVEGIYDNTASNPYNPNHPPKEIRERKGSMKSSDEMFQLIITYVPYQHGDETIKQ